MMNQWLIVENENWSDLFPFDTFVSMDVKRSGTVVSEPIEKGSFVSYNKITEPLTVDVTVGITGDDERLQEAIRTLEALQHDAVVFTILSADTEYQNLALESYSYKRQRNEGRGVLWVDLSCVEIREVQPQYTTAKVVSKKAAKKPDAATAVDRGKAQTKPVPQSYLSKGLDAVKGAGK